MVSNDEDRDCHSEFQSSGTYFGQCEICEAAKFDATIPNL